MKKIYQSLLILLCLFSAKSFAQCTTPATVPYYVDFNNITANNQLPLCWAASNLSITCLTYTNTQPSQNSAAFYYFPAGSNYFYSGAIQLFAGITYSTGCWYKVSSYSATVWTDFSILIGTSQNNTGLVSIATATNISNLLYTQLTGTFTVPSSGVYYMAIRGTSNGAPGSQELDWTDFSIRIPCGTASPNTPTVNITANTNTICSGSTLTLVASGANTYAWNVGSSSATLTDSPAGNTTYVVIGSNTLTGCTSTVTQIVTVYNSPPILVYANLPGICPGSSATISATGASTYSWSTGQQGVSITVTPTANTTYMASSTNSNGCVSTASLTISLYQTPVITITTLATDTICSGETATLGASGAVSYQWTSNLANYSGSSITFTPLGTTAFTVVGVDANTCSGKTNYVLNVNACTGLNKTSGSGTGFKIYPNPGNGIYTIESLNTEIKTILITNLTGQIVFSGNSLDERIKIDLRNFSNGIYNVKVSSGSSTNHLKIIKQ